MIRFFIFVILALPLQSHSASQPQLSIRTLGAGQVQAAWPSTFAGYTLEASESLGTPAWQPVSPSPVQGQTEFFTTLSASQRSLFLRLRGTGAVAPATISDTSPSDGETGVAVTRETILHFSVPLAENTALSSDTLYATFGGRRILSRMELSTDRTRVSLFYLEPLPGSARVTVLFNGDSIKDVNGLPVDADGDGVPGGVAIIGFDTLSLTELAGTAVIGKVYASEPQGLTPQGAPINKPLEGVTVTVDGREQELRAVTDAQGSFTLSPVPPGRFFVKIDGRTAKGSLYPNGAYYPYVGKAWEAVAGVTTNLAGGTGEIFLPLIAPGTLQPVSSTVDTTVNFPASVVQANPALAGVAITVPANALFSDDGARGGKVGIAPVPPDRLPGPLPPGVTMPLVITVQTDGPLNFDRPAPICFPNTENLEPGRERALLSFNHKKGEWEVVGSMTVSADGKTICTDPGVGVLQPGWHGQADGVAVGGGEPVLSNCDPNKFVYDRDEDRCELVSTSGQGRAAYCQQIYISCKLGCSDCLPEEIDFNSCIQYCTVSMARCNQRSDICPWPPQEDEEDDSSSQLPMHPRAPSSALQALSTSTRVISAISSAGLHYYAIENVSRNTVEQRGTSIGSGPVLAREVILAPRTQYRLWVLSANNLRVASADFTTPASGRRITLPPVFLWPDYTADADADVLKDTMEMIIGSNPAAPDSDKDGIQDGVEIAQGLNPLDGLPVKTGIIATTRTPGAARDIFVGNSLVVTAEGPSGLSIFNTYEGAAPTMLAHVPFAAAVTRVTGSGNFLAAAGANLGLAIVDVRDPALPVITKVLNIAGAQAVTAGGGIVYAGSTSGQITVIDLRSGLIQSSLLLPAEIQDLALERGYLYALVRDRLFVLSLDNDSLEIKGSVAAPVVQAAAGGNTRLFVGNGIAYSVQPRGYSTFDVANPAAPVLLATGNTPQLGWKQIVLNGSGLGIAAVGPNLSDDGPHDISLYDASNPRTNNLFVATFATPGVARAVALFNGLAYVADDKSGLQIINYLAFDAKGVPPSIALEPGFASTGAEEGSLTYVSARVGDDVQVRNVEFYLNGIRSHTDGAFPFEYRFIAPARSAAVSNLAIRARVFDTGGNATWSDEITVPLVPDSTAPHVSKSAPVSGGKALTTVLALFNEPMNPATLTPTSFQVFASGADGQPGTSDDTIVSGGFVSYVAETRLATLAFPTPLSNGRYRAVVTTAASDLAGNHLTADYSWEFRVADAIFWTRTADGTWSDPLNWSSGAVPGPADDAIVDVPGNVTISQNGGTISARSIQLNNRLALSGVTVRNTAISQLEQGKISVSGAQTILDGVTIDGGLDLSTGSNVQVQNGLKLTTSGTPGGLMRLGGGAVLGFRGNQSFGPATVEFTGANSGILGIAGATTLTLEQNVFIHGRNGSVGQPVTDANGVQALVNRGTIGSDVNGGSITINPDQFQNEGLLQSSNGGFVNITAPNWTTSARMEVTTNSRLTLGGQWSNSGIITVNGGVLNLDTSATAPLTLTRLGQVNRTGGTINLSTLLDNSGGTLALNDQTGPWTLNGGTLKGGTVTQTGAGRLRVEGVPSILDGVALEGGIDLSAGGNLQIINGIKLMTGGNPGGVVRLGGGAVLGFRGTQTFGPADVQFVGASSGILGIAGPTTLTLDTGVVIHGANGNIGQPVTDANGIQKLVNLGTILADTSGRTLLINPDEFQNSGTVRSANGTINITAPNWSSTGQLETSPGSTLTLGGQWSNTGAINVSGGVLNLDTSSAAPLTLARLGQINRTGGTVNLSTTLDLTGGILALTPVTGSWTLNGGGIKGGIVTQTGGAKLLVTGTSSTLDNVTVDGDLDLSNGGIIQVVNGLNLTTSGAPGGTARLGGGAVLGFRGTQTFGPATVEFVGTSSGILGIAGPTTLTLNPGVVVRGRNGVVGQPVVDATGIQSLINLGAITSDISGFAININPDQFQNGGTVEARNGARINITAPNWTSSGQLSVASNAALSLQGQWSNTGAINVNSGNLTLDSSAVAPLTLARLGQLNRTGGTVSLSTTLDNTGGTLALTALTGPWTLVGGAIKGGTVTQNGARLLVSGTISILDGVTLDGDLDLSTGGNLQILNGLTLTTSGTPGGTIRLGGGAVLGFRGTQTFDRGTVEFVGTSSAILGIAGPSTLTLGSGVLIHGRNGHVGQPVTDATGTQTLINQGAILADVANTTITVNPDVFINNGTASTANGGKLILPP